MKIGFYTPKNILIILGFSVGITVILWSSFILKIIQIPNAVLFEQISIHLLINLILYSFFVSILPKYSTYSLEEKKTFYLIAFYNLIFLTASISNSLIYYFVYQDNINSYKNSVLLFLITYFFQNIILLFIILTNRKRKTYSHFHPSSTQNSFEEEVQDTISIVSKQSKEKLIFSLKDFLFVKSSENYSEFYLLKKDTVTREIMRLTLKSIEEQISNHHYIARTHKSYIVNLKQDIEIKGNANETKIFIENFTIPVSRSRRKKILEIFKNIHS